MDETRVLAIGPPDPTVDAVRRMRNRPPPVRVFGPVPAAHVDNAFAPAAPHVVLAYGDTAAMSQVFGAVRALDPSVRVLFRATSPTDSMLAAVLEAGGCGLIPADVEPAVLRESILRARAGELLADADGLMRLLRTIGDLRSPTIDPKVSSLTGREIEVLTAIAEGLHTQDIAVRLGITVGTVQAHVKNILAKLNVHSKVDAVRIAWRAGLFPLPA